ncbi:MAG: MerR family transcriptional regulator [Kineosporiaceae bacterium]|nr:MerR family transcriptional regulator [Kineosporiaceae bacterium]
MVSIGEFARLGQVTVRMLRHYDQIGLLTPDRVDPASGYRSYAADQLARLHRIVALKDLGFTLDAVHRMLDDDLAAEELRGMLRLRQIELVTEHAQAQARLAGVEHRLRLIEKEKQMSQVEYVVKSLPARTVAVRPASVGSPEEIAGVMGRLFGEVAQAIGAAGGRPESALATYSSDDEGGVNMLVGFDYAGAEAPGFEVHTLPAIEAVCAVHLGAMDTIGASWQALFSWVEAQGWKPTGPCREIYLKAFPLDDQSGWVTELQQPVTR